MISLCTADMSPVWDTQHPWFLPGCGFAILHSQSCLLMWPHVLSSHLLSLALSHVLCSFLWPYGCSWHMPKRTWPLCLYGYSPLPPDCSSLPKSRYRDSSPPCCVWVSIQMLSSQRAFSNHCLQNSFPQTFYPILFFLIAFTALCTYIYILTGLTPYEPRAPRECPALIRYFKESH